MTAEMCSRQAVGKYADQAGRAVHPHTTGTVSEGLLDKPLFVCLSFICGIIPSMARPKGSKNLGPRQRVTDEQLLLARGLPPEKRDEIVGDLIQQKAVQPYKRRSDKRVLANLIRDIGEEVIDPTLGWTRIEALVRRLYNDAMAGKTPAAELLLDRGWGKVPTPVDVDISGEVRKLTINAGLSWTEISADPVLRKLIELSGVTPDEAVLLETSHESTSREPGIVDGTFTESQS